MNLATYVELLPRGGKKLFAIRLGVTASYLSRLISGDRSITAERAIQIEDATEGAVSRAELRPDIQWEKSKRPKKACLHLRPTLSQMMPQKTVADQSGKPSGNPYSAGVAR
ncbi:MULTISPECIES: transcriptional regulator [Pseudomonas]|uniref:transcriptional regulator n=1 Tax=Pseudomonas TaxID=286 RepID=UPI0018E7362E|nr:MULTISPECIES: YdaS family helix-turn-helix protein [Pseudomonas]MBJ2204602.1 helix-turn-helix domain-containing protein [Pseudomonas carnis]MBJ2303162.1 helix-turn-helix domain-containing protein [Pseudomonas sp. MF2846]MBK3488275.1 helix-turn-helix domain-containing protein [Pseudomonas sp. MF2857]